MSNTELEQDTNTASQEASSAEGSSESVTRDPIYYWTAAFFAFITTAIPSLMGQPRLLPILQTLALTVFVAVAIHRRNLRGAFKVVVLWLSIQIVILTLLVRIFPPQLERAFNNGFLYRGAITAWYFAGAPFPNGIVTNPVGHLLEFLGILLGSIATAGLLGMWFLVRLVNQVAFATGILMTALANPLRLLLVIPYWMLLRAAGYAGFVLIGAEPLLTYNWSPSYYWQRHRKAIVTSFALLILSWLLEFLFLGLIGRGPLR
jgi:hypothetical protein